MMVLTKRIYLAAFVVSCATFALPLHAESDAAGLKISGSNEKLPGGRHVIHLRWTCQRSDVSSFEVEEKCEDGTGGNYHIVYLAPGGRSGEYVETDIQPGAYYDFRIRADYDDGTVSDYR